MSNHYHLVIRIDKSLAESWDSEEVERRWSTLYRLPAAYLVAKSACAGTAGALIKDRFIELWRSRLVNLGWLMRSVNEPLARLANREDECTGRFWEGRFRSQALLDEAAVLKCMAYVDLNPVRAGISHTPEDSKHTSIQARLESRSSHLAAFSGDSDSGIAPSTFRNYLEFVDWTGRYLQLTGKSRIPADTPPILQRLHLRPREWIDALRRRKPFRNMAMGSPAKLLRYKEHLKRYRIDEAEPTFAL